MRFDLRQDGMRFYPSWPRLAYLYLCLIALSLGGCLSLEMTISTSADGQHELVMDYLLSPMYIRLSEADALGDYLMIPANPQVFSDRVNRHNGTLVAFESAEAADGLRALARITFPDAESLAGFINSGAVQARYLGDSGLNRLVFTANGLAGHRNWSSAAVQAYTRTVFAASAVRVVFMTAAPLRSSSLPILAGNRILYEKSIPDFLFGVEADLIEIVW